MQCLGTRGSFQKLKAGGDSENCLPSWYWRNGSVSRVLAEKAWDNYVQIPGPCVKSQAQWVLGNPLLRAGCRAKPGEFLKLIGLPVQLNE